MYLQVAEINASPITQQYEQSEYKVHNYFHRNYNRYREYNNIIG